MRFSSQSPSQTLLRGIFALVLLTLFALDVTAQRSQQQGARYGDPNFEGEKINLNVVNADIRDILNYITEQYGVNFVIDKSVKQVPVTVNVSDVPWNVALRSVLDANGLAIDSNGVILRVADATVLAQEADVRKRNAENQLDVSPLYTEFIRLNYARASGTLATAAGSSGAFTGGGSGGNSFGGDVNGGGGDQGVLPIIKRRLSRRGSIEVDGRSNTLIITDVRQNIDSIRQLIGLLDQPEPQVEIEARIVVASRNFSRELGVQLSAFGFNGAQGAGGTASTVGGAPTPANGPVTGNATSRSLIGLTTGAIGSFQLNVLINAAETKGQAKTISTPRITTLNNRAAQIESGQQIPVVNAQTNGGGAGGNAGATIFTTTFIAVPLRLSVTPQISDNGTVILRVVAENNTVNTALANGGTPGIDTQRMQTEVLVPNGGTTVVGGALLDNENETRDRTPGLASIPIVGNLFKRRATARTTNEILFFITPRIYRPDTEGNPTSSTIDGTTRPTTLVQPVPLGNPATNSNTPTETSQPQLNLPTQPLVQPLVVQPSTTAPATPQSTQTTTQPRTN